MGEPSETRPGQTEGGVGLATVYVLDSHEYTRAMLVELLNASGGVTVVGSSSSAGEGLREILNLRPQVAVLDANLSDGDALAICRTLKTSAPETASVILSAGTTTPWEPEQAAAAGAAAYILKQPKDFPLLKLITSIATQPNRQAETTISGNTHPAPEPY